MRIRHRLLDRPRHGGARRRRAPPAPSLLPHASPLKGLVPERHERRHPSGPAGIPVPSPLHPCGVRTGAGAQKARGDTRRQGGGRDGTWARTSDWAFI